MTCDRCPFVLPCWQYLLQLFYCTCGALHLLPKEGSKGQYAIVRCDPLRETLAHQNRRYDGWENTPLDLHGQPVDIVPALRRTVVQRCARCCPELFPNRADQKIPEHYLDRDPTTAVDHEEFRSLYRRRTSHEEIL